MNKLTFSIIIYFSIITFSLKAQDNLSLDKALSYALDNNFEIAITKLNDSIAKTNNSWAAAGALPIISFSGVSSNTRNFDIDQTTTPNQPAGNNTVAALSAGVNLNWVLFDGFKVRIRKEKFEQLEAISNGNSLAVIEATLQSTIRAYYQTLIEKEKLKVYEFIQKISADRYEYEKIKKEYGNSTSFDESRAKTVFMSDKANYINQKAVYNNSIRNLKYTLNLPDSISINLTDSLSAPNADFDSVQLVNDFIANNSNLKTMYINLELQKNEIKMAKADYYPTLTLSAGSDYTHTYIGYEEIKSTNTGADAYAKLALNYTIFKAGYRKRAVAIAQISETITTIEIEDMKRSLSNHLYNTLDLYKTQKEMLSATQESFKAAALNLELADEKFKNGTINSFNYRDIQLNYQQAALSILNTEGNLINSYTELLRLSGKIVSESKN
ncbi:MAG: TolC family protein [Bacteroidales bacterium]|nr:TolC family protein [Bacteroidales bacterium]